MLLLLVVAVVVTDVVTLSSLRSYLYGRLDEQNDVAQSQAYVYIETLYRRAVAADRAVASDPGPWLAQLSVPSATFPELGGSGGDNSPSSPAPVSSDVAGPPSAGNVPRTGQLVAGVLAARISPDIYMEVLSSDRRVLFRRPSGTAAHEDPSPVLPKAFPVQRLPRTTRYGTSHGPYLPDQQTFTAGAEGHRGAYYLSEALAVPGGIIVTTDAISPSDQTLSSLRRIEILVSVGVVLVMLLLALWTVRLGLRPLDDMTDTARAIAGGDLRRRIRRAGEHGEVGRLGAALNGMLGRIEAAMAERATSEHRLRQFVADASHELRTPLTSIRGYAELLRKGALRDEPARRRAAERIELEATRMGVLVDDLLLLARLDQGRPLELAPLELGTLVSDAVEMVRGGDPARPVDFAHPEPLWVLGDPGRLRQVVDNLLQNAVVHTPGGTPVHVSLTRRGRRAVLAVGDEGQGLRPEQAAHVFDRFYRGEEARARPGTGLGLSIVAALAEAHGGEAKVGPRPGGGAEFVVELPLATSDSGAGPPGTPAATAEPGSGGGDETGSGAITDPGDGTMAARGRRVGDAAAR
jgi:two-component system OmpR family sensor kinase